MKENNTLQKDHGIEEAMDTKMNDTKPSSAASLPGDVLDEYDDFDLSEDDIEEFSEEGPDADPAEPDSYYEEAPDPDEASSYDEPGDFNFEELRSVNDGSDDQNAIHHSGDAVSYDADPYDRNSFDADDHEMSTSGKTPSDGRRILLVLLGIVAVLVVIYLAGCAYFAGHFAPRTTINGNSVAMMSAGKAEQTLASSADSYTLTVNGRSGVSDILSGADISYGLTYTVSLDSLVKDSSPFAWPLHLIRQTDYDIESIASYDETALTSAIEHLAFFREDNIVQPSDSACSYVDGSYQIVSGDPGTVPDEAGITNAIVSALTANETEVTLGDDCYQAADDEELTQTAELLNQILNLTVTIPFGDETETLTKEELASFISAPQTTASNTASDAASAIDASSMTKEELLQAQKVLNLSRIAFQDETLSEYVKALAEKYNTKSETREFTTHSGETITVSGGSYGWEMDEEGTVTALKDFLAGAQSGEFEPVWTQEAASHGETDIGTTYAEVDLDEQHVYVYVDGTCVMDTDCVSGKAIDSDRYTPTGTYSIAYRKSPAVLKGDGYESPVTYWMPFNRGIGFHDATWRSKFGGELYLTGGSHGCINLPYSAAKELYSYVYTDMPVIVHGGMTPEEAQKYTGKKADPPVTVKESETDIGGGADETDSSAADAAAADAQAAADTAAATQAIQDAQNAVLQQAIQNYINQGMSAEQAQAQVQADLAAQLAAQQAAAAQ